MTQEILVKSKTKIRSGVRVNTYEIISRAVESGISYGWSHAHKHTDTPTEEEVKNQIEMGIMNEMCEVLLFDDDE